MSKSLAILGAGGHGKVVADAARATGDWEHIFFFDDSYPCREQSGDWKIVGNFSDLLDSHSTYDGIFVAIGCNKARLEWFNKLKEKGAHIVSICHPAAVISPSASIQDGCVVCALAVVNPDAIIGYACIINTGAIVEHDCVLNEGVHLSPNATLAGAAKVGSCSWIGVGAVTKQQIDIGSNAIVGAGAVVIDSVPDNVVVAGVPAKTVQTLC